ncbi:MAG: PLP-dependent cysteine synthase family protein [Bradymonadaceae bacterium]
MVHRTADSPGGAGGPGSRADDVPPLFRRVGDTPLVQLRSVTDHLDDGVEVCLKLEYTNPGGSVKDRPARQIILDALADGRLGEGQTLIDSTSGNTGVAYSMLGSAAGIDVALVMPENVSAARKHITRTYGAELIFSDPMEGSDGAIRRVREIVEGEGGDQYFYADQYGNPSNPRAHERTTAPEIWRQTGGDVTHFVAGTGTSGTIMGTGWGLRERNADIQLIGVQPEDGFHGLEGLKHMPSAIEPDIYREQELDEVRFVSTDASWEMAERLGREEGIAAGYSTGANVLEAVRVAEEIDEGTVVTLACDHADRYFEE